MEGSIRGEGCELIIPAGDKKPLEEIEKALTKKYRKTLWSKFTKALNDFELIEEGDSIAVAVSGGKDSLLMAKLFQELKKHRKFNFEVRFITMDPGYHRHIRELLEENTEYLGIKTEIFDSKVFDVIDDIARDYPCYMCARMRRGNLYAKARELGCNKVALGHHMDDVIETVMLNMVYGGSYKAMPPKLHSTNFEGMELIRPLYYIEEKDIRKWIDDIGIMPLNCACMVSAKRTGNKRYAIKDLIESMKSLNKDIKKSILRSTENVYLDTTLGYIRDGSRKSFHEVYEERSEEDDE